MDKVFGPFWSIGVEEQFYLVWPALVLSAPRRHLLKLFVIVIVAAPIIRYLLTPAEFIAVYTLMPCRMDLLAAGALLALLETRAPDVFPRNRQKFFILAILAMTAFAAISFADRTFRTGSGLPLFNVVGFALVACFAVGTFGYVRSLEKGMLTRLLTSGPFAYVGKVSYTCYLVHAVVIELVSHAHLGTWRSAPIALVGTVLVATITWYGFENRVARLRRLLPERAVASTLQTPRAAATTM
jgi:peptidoglycan/LPS O-acetylase OafA/YrhL